MALSNEGLVQLFQEMMVCRYFEDKMAQEAEGWHSGVGEEASFVGAFFGLSKEDFVAPHLRGGYSIHYLKGMPLEEVFGELYGRLNGAGHGKAIGLVGSMKYHTIPWNMGGLGPILTTSAGVALSIKLRHQPGIVMLNFGDGVGSRGEFHESLNFCAVKKLPIVWVCQNNQWAMGTATDRAVANPNIVERAHGYAIPGVTVDGNDVMAVYNAAQTAIARARAGEGPSLIECKTYRLKGHTVSDSGWYKVKEVEEAWLNKDPIKRFAKVLMDKKLLTQSKWEELDAKAKAKVETAYDNTVNKGARPKRDKEFLLSGVYAP